VCGLKVSLETPSSEARRGKERQGVFFCTSIEVISLKTGPWWTMWNLRTIELLSVETCL